MGKLKCFFGFHRLIRIVFSRGNRNLQNIVCCTECQYTEWQFLTGYKKIKRSKELNSLIRERLNHSTVDFLSEFIYNIVEQNSEWEELNEKYPTYYELSDEDKEKYRCLAQPLIERIHNRYVILPMPTKTI